MLIQNQTYFMLLGFSDNPRTEIIVFTGLLLIYTLSLLGNLIIIAATYMDQKLQIPMYILLSSLAAVDICFLSSTARKFLASLVVSHNRRLSLTGCLMQFFSYYSFGIAEFCTLALLSIDRYLAVCYPLQYSTIMTRKLCCRLILSSWIFSFLEFLPAFLAFSKLNFCSRLCFINHFFCDGSTLLNVSCTNPRLAGNIFLTTTSFTILSSLISTLYSYICILSSIFRISSSNNRRKTFSTCSSHLIAVVITYGCCSFIYVRPAGSMSTSYDTVVAVFNSIFIPLLNPIIYTLRNHMIKKTLKGFFKL